MRQRGVVLILASLAGCGGRTMLDDDLGGGQALVSPFPEAGTEGGGAVDAAPDLLSLDFPDTAPPSSASLPAYTTPGICFGTVTRTPNVTCAQSAGGTTDNCNAEITCAGNVLQMQCQAGVCTCLNPAFGDTCYCAPPAGAECTVANNCCWQ